MSEFDPYFQWLGIPPEDQPADHYRLLGVPRFVANLDVIENAADRQMAHVRTFQSGPQSELSQRLLNELSSARLCLLTAEAKATYDAELQTQLSQQSTSLSTELDSTPQALPVEPILPPTAPQARQENDTVQGNASPESPLPQPQHDVVDDQPRVGMPRIRRTRGRRGKGGPWSAPVQLLGVVLGGSGGIAVALFILQIGFGVDPLGLWSDRSAVVQRPPAVPSRQTPRTTPKKKQPVKRSASTSPSSDPRTEQRGSPQVAPKVPNSGKPKTINLLERMQAQPDLLEPGWRWASSFFLADKHANGHTVTVPVPELADAAEYTLVFDFENVGRRTGKPRFTLYFPVYGGGHLRAYYYYGRSYALSFHGTEELHPSSLVPNVTTREHLGRRELKVHVGKQRTRVEFNGQAIGQFDTPKSKTISDAMPPTVKMTGVSGSWMQFRVHQLKVIFPPSAKEKLAELAANLPHKAAEEKADHVRISASANATSEPTNAKSVGMPDGTRPKPAIAPFDTTRAVKHQLDWAAFLSKDVTITNSIGMAMKLIPPGEFMMGDAKTAHRVTLTSSRYLGVFEVTRAQYAEVMGTGNNGINEPDHPVASVSWTQALEFCRKLSELPAEKARGSFYRLPTEAEWEFACRAGTESVYSFGDDPVFADDYCWHAGNSENKHHPVGQKLPNAFGLHDMHGNVWEWCSDFSSELSLEPQTDPTGPPTGPNRVARGNCSESTPSPCSHRNTKLAIYGKSHGLRVVMAISPKSLAKRKIAAKTPTGPVPLPAILPFDSKQAGSHQQKWADHLGVPVEFANSLGLRLRFVPPGEFDMGSNEGAESERPVHKVKLTRGFYLGVVEVTQEQYRRVMLHVPPARSGRKADPSDGNRYPVDGVSWGDAVEFCRRLSTWPEEGKNLRAYRLPTEAEWEYATRAGTNSKWWCGDDLKELEKFEWYNVHGASSRGVSVHFVGKKPANPWGFHDMAGNTWEFCNDRFGPYPNATVDNPTGPEGGPHRVIRGGCWFVGSNYCRSTSRTNTAMARHRMRIIGFRVALDLPYIDVRTSDTVPDTSLGSVHRDGGASQTISKGEGDFTRLEMSRLTQPAAGELKAKRAEVETLFAEELQQIEPLKNLAEYQKPLSDLADKAQRLASDPQADVALRYALFHWAFVWSKKAGNSNLAVAVTQEWERTFQGVDGCTLRTRAIEEWSELKMPASLRQDLLELTLREAEAAALADRWKQVGILYALAQQGYAQVIRALRDANEQAAVKVVVAEQRDLRRRRDPLAAFVKALSELQEDESKGEANDVVGRYYAVVRGDWQQGLPYLARSAEGALQSAAVLDLAGAQDGAGQVAIGDRWWDLAETRTTREAQPEWAEFLQRAGHWYAQGQDRVSEAEQVRVAKRLAKIQASNRPAPPPTLELGLLAYYPFNGNAKDESGNGHDGKIEGPELTDDRHGKANSAYAFRGGRDVIRIADHELLRPGQITISGWSFRTVSRSGAFVSKTEFTNGNLPRGEQFQLEIDDSLAKFLIKRNSEGRPGNGWQRLESIGEVALERWVMVTATWDGFSQKIYLDGSMQGKNDDAPHGNIDNVPGGELLLGSSWVPGSGHFSGLIDDVRIYNRSLSAAEVKALYDYEKPVTSHAISRAGVEERGNEGFSPQTRK